MRISGPVRESARSRVNAAVRAAENPLLEVYVSEVRAVVATGKGAPVEVTTIIVPDPGPGEAVVRVQACGVCHTDLH
ncbi:hypothetical protein ABZ805_11215, partial [Saccharopolyspora sp. NPDC047091]